MRVGAPVQASSQKGSVSLGGSSNNATASTNITSSPLAVVALAPRQGTFYQPESGLGQARAEGNRRHFDPLPQLAAEAEGSGGAKGRQGAGDGISRGQGGSQNTCICAESVRTKSKTTSNPDDKRRRAHYRADAN